MRLRGKPAGFHTVRVLFRSGFRCRVPYRSWERAVFRPIGFDTIEFRVIGFRVIEFCAIALSLRSFFVRLKGGNSGETACKGRRNPDGISAGTKDGQTEGS